MDSVALFCTGAVLAGSLYWFVCVLGSAEVKGKRAVHLSGGSISPEHLHDNYSQYWSFFRRPKEIDAAAKDQVPHFVDTFYNLVTDIYEWGWGQSFHFSPSLPGLSHRDATAAHERRAVDLLSLPKPSTILDVGCGVGGPMRAIADHSGARVVGITINEYQVERARAHNRKAGLEGQCEVVCGNFLSMPFPDASFDGAYSIEATCHAPRLEDVYGEIFRVLRPGAMYVSYEWVTTELYETGNPEHVEIAQGIERGDALPGLRRHDEVAAASSWRRRRGGSGSRLWRSATWPSPPPGSGGAGSRWGRWRTGGTMWWCRCCPGSASPPKGWWRCTRCCSGRPATSPAAARPASSRPCTWSSAESLLTPRLERGRGR